MKYNKVLPKIILLSTLCASLTGCNDKTPNLQTFNKDTVIGSFNNNPFTVTDVIPSLESVAPFLANIYYEDKIMKLVAVDNKIDTANKSVNQIRTELMTLLTKTPSDKDVLDYIETNKHVYYDFNLNVAKYPTYEDASKSTTHKFIPTGFTQLQLHTNEILSTEKGYKTKEPIPYEEGYAVIEVLEAKLRSTAKEDAMSDIISQNTFNLYQECINKKKLEIPFEGVELNVTK